MNSKEAPTVREILKELEELQKDEKERSTIDRERYRRLKILDKNIQAKLKLAKELYDTLEQAWAESGNPLIMSSIRRVREDILLLENLYEESK